MSDPPRRYFLVGPTAAGKKEIGLRLLARMEVEYISLDSMKIYRGMDIGTAKMSEEVRESRPIHMVDIVEPDASFSVADYVRRAENVEEEIRERGLEPLFVGGTPMYLKRMLEGLFDGPEADWGFRNQLKETAEERGRPHLHKKLKQVDPERARDIHPNDMRRVIRALEVYEKTGTPMSEHLRQSRREARRYDIRAVCLLWDRRELHRRIENRVDRMLEKGFQEEVRNLLDREDPPGKQALQACGYSEMIEYLEGHITREEMKQDMISSHRQLVRKQMTWFRNMEEHLQFLEMKMDTPVDRAVQQVLERYKETGTA